MTLEELIKDLDEGAYSDGLDDKAMRQAAVELRSLLAEKIELMRQLREAESELAKLKFYHYPQGEST